MVGAINVASIETSWSGIVAPRSRAITRWRYGQPVEAIELHRGDELGCFHLGSTVVVISGSEKREWDPAVMVGEKISIGQSLLVPQTPDASGHTEGA